MSYQRFLAWKLARTKSLDLLIYLDDDLRIISKEALSKILQPFIENQEVVGVTSACKTGDVSKFRGIDVWVDQRSLPQRNRFIVNKLSSSKKTQPGGISPTGNRKIPVYRGNPYEEVSWLQGRVMAYRYESITEECFSEDLFALDHIRCGLGEDTFLSRNIGAHGKLVFYFDAGFEHPDDDSPKSYPTKAYKFGLATAYSRRFLNDHFRPFSKPFFVDRVALLKTYLGNNFLNAINFVRKPTKSYFLYAIGYGVGSLRGIFINPTAKYLTPSIRWWEDSQIAVTQTQEI